MEKILQGIPHVVCYIDDVLVTGGTEEEHTKNLAEVLKRFEEWGLRLKLQKCFFMQGSVEYLGYVIDAQGLHTAPEKVKAVVDTPQPNNQQQLRAFLGLVNGFYPSISVNKLLRQNAHWKWTADCDMAFQACFHPIWCLPIMMHPCH